MAQPLSKDAVFLILILILYVVTALSVPVSHVAVRQRGACMLDEVQVKHISTVYWFS